MKDPLYIYVDVDDTLIRKGENGEEIPQRKVTEHICELHRQGTVLYCWSNGGEKHAREAAQRLGIEGCFTDFLKKPQVFIDDERSEEWPNFVHISPEEISTLEEYRKAVATKRDGKKE